jgi:hypothetical protein
MLTLPMRSSCEFHRDIKPTNVMTTTDSALIGITRGGWSVKVLEVIRDPRGMLKPKDEPPV